MEAIMKEKSEITKNMVPELIIAKRTIQLIMDNGLTDRDVVKEGYNFQMGLYMKDNLIMEIKKEMEK